MNCLKKKLIIIFQKKVFQSVLGKYPNDLIITKFEIVNSEFFGLPEEEEKKAKEVYFKEKYDFLESVGFAEPRIPSVCEDEFMMVYIGNSVGYDYLDLFGLCINVSRPIKVEENTECEELLDDEDSSMYSWELDELAKCGAFSDEGIYPDDFKDGYLYEFDEYMEFRRKRSRRFEKTNLLM